MQTDLNKIESDVIRNAMVHIFNHSIEYEIDSPISEDCCKGKPDAKRLISTVKCLDNLLTEGSDMEYGDADEGIIDQAITDIVDCLIGIQVARRSVLKLEAGKI